MKSKNKFYIFIIAIIQCLNGCNSMAVPNPNNNCTLVVNQHSISEKCYVHINHEENFVELPLLAISKSLGAKVTWKSKTIVTIQKGNLAYILDVQAQSLTTTTGENMILAAPGDSIKCDYYNIAYRDYMLDHITISYFLSFFDMQVSVNWDTNTVYIQHSNNTGDG